jgi:hypothetical protein
MTNRPVTQSAGSGWLAAWMAEQLRSGAAQPSDLRQVQGDAMYVYGSIGVDVALTSTGAVWVKEYDLDTVEEPTAAIEWRHAEKLERIGYLVIAIRRFPTLRHLLPSRPHDATACPACRGTGDWHVFSLDRKESLRIRGSICKSCGGLGWQGPADA